MPKYLSFQSEIENPDVDFDRERDSKKEDSYIHTYIYE